MTDFHNYANNQGYDFNQVSNAEKALIWYFTAHLHSLVQNQ